LDQCPLAQIRVPATWVQQKHSRSKSYLAVTFVAVADCLIQVCSRRGAGRLPPHWFPVPLYRSIAILILC